MKNLLGLVVIILVLTGCTKRNQDGAVLLEVRNDGDLRNPYIEVIDSCEYVIWGSRMAHKGNCRFCAKRRDTQSAIIIESYYGEDKEY